ncbi:MAG: hypothetical protein WCW31_00475 [Patescibacteria group bacterium]
MKPVLYEGDFHKSINKAIKEKRHVDYLKNVLHEYEEYKNYMDKVLLDSAPAKDIYLFRAKYLNKKPVWRDIEIASEQTLEEMAESIIDAMGWANDHLHAFTFPKSLGKTRSYPFGWTSIFSEGVEDDPHPTYKTQSVKIYQIDYEKFPKFHFSFDFGDGHEFEILYKGQRGYSGKTSLFPRLINQHGVAPEQYPDWNEDESTEEGAEDLKSFVPFDDCSICQAMQEAAKQGRELTKNELKNAFDQANNHQKI